MTTLQTLEEKPEIYSDPPNFIRAKQHMMPVETSTYHNQLVLHFSTRPVLSSFLVYQPQKKES